MKSIFMVLKSNKGYGYFVLILAIMVIIVIINIYLASVENKNVKHVIATPTQKTKPSQTVKIKTPEEIRIYEINKFFSSWDGSHIGLERYIKKSMDDPSSYNHAETRYIDKGDHLIVSTIFRGKNKFGALIKNTVVARTDLKGNVIEIINSK